MKILVVDDSKAMRLIVTRTLKQAGYTGHQVLEAVDGNDALKQVQEHSPDFIFSDWNMPELTGIELLRALREAGNTTSFGFITSEATDEMHNTAKEAGALFFITKPFTVEAFEAALRPHLP